MSYSIAVVAHQKRSDAAHALQEQVRAQYLAMDNGTHGVEGNHRRCWEYLAKQDSEWAITLEDDCLPVKDFNHQLEMVLEAAPTAIVSLYLGTGRPAWFQPEGKTGAAKLQPRIRDAIARAETEDASWITTDRHCHGVAVAIKTDLIPDMLASVENDKQPIDYAIMAWAQHTQRQIGFTVPSLVDHLDGPTLTGLHNRDPRVATRKAWRVGTREHWTKRAVAL